VTAATAIYPPVYFPAPEHDSTKRPEYEQTTQEGSSKRARAL